MPRTVHMYCYGWLPGVTGDGTSAALYSDVRAYLDLGWTVEYVHVAPTKPSAWPTDDGLRGVQWSFVPLPGAGRDLARAASRVAYWIGWPIHTWLPYRFRASTTVRQEVLRRWRANPGALHQFETTATAAGAVHLPGLKSILRVHDIESAFVEKHHAIRREVEAGVPPMSERRALRRLAAAERLIAHDSQLVLCYARHECDRIRDEWRCQQTEYVPISWPDEQPVTRTRPWIQDGRLRLLHVGRVDSLPSFRSLQFLLADVLPRLDRAVTDRLELVIVGEVRESNRARKIRDLASRFANVSFLGHQADLRPLYGAVDLQIVGSTEATGLRTRIIESMAFGLPVVSTIAGAAGLDGDDEIVLADGPQAFADRLREFADDPARLERMAERGRRHYDDRYSRKAIAARLDHAVSRHFA